MISLYIKEIKSFLSSIIGYVFVGVFLIISGLFLWVFPNVDNIPDAGLADLHGLFNLSQFLFLFLVPAITMRSFAEERRTGTMDLLLTKPLTDWQIIWAKFLSCLTLLVIALLPTLVYVVTVILLGNPVGNLDMGSTWGSYLGLILLGAVYISIGLFSSSLSNNQIIALAAVVVINILSSYLFFRLHHRRRALLHPLLRVRLHLLLRLARSGRLLHQVARHRAPLRFHQQGCHRQPRHHLFLQCRLPLPLRHPHRASQTQMVTLESPDIYEKEQQQQQSSPWRPWSSSTYSPPIFSSAST